MEVLVNKISAPTSDNAEKGQKDHHQLMEKNEREGKMHISNQSKRDTEINLNSELREMQHHLRGRNVVAIISNDVPFRISLEEDSCDL